MIAGASRAPQTAASSAPASTRGIAVAPTIDLGDHAMGRRSVHDVPVFNLDPGLVAHLRIEVVGHRALQLVEAPTHLRPSWSVAGAAHPIRIAFSPESEPRYAAKLVIHAGWEMNRRPPEVLEVPITAVAHAPGQPTVAEQRASEAAARARADEERTSAEARARTEEQIARYHEQPVLRHHEGHRKTLYDKRARLEAAMVDLSNRRHIGVTQADANIGEFKRKQPVSEKPSLISQLAWAALDVATGGIASGVSRALRQPLTSLLTSSVTELGRDVPYPVSPVTRVTPPSDAIVGFLTDGVKNTVKKVGSELAGEPEAASSDPSHAIGDHSLDAKAAFIAEQTNAFWGNAHVNATVTTQFVYDSLLVSVLDRNPQAAFAAMDQVSEAVEIASNTVAETQRVETLRHWVRYLAQTSLGSTSDAQARTRGLVSAKDASPLTDLRSATHAPDEHRPMRTFDGLVDLQFTINERDPLEPAQVRSAKLHGVRREVAKVLASRSLLDGNVPVRAFAVAASGPSRSANVPLTVTRDEAGNIDHVDNLRVEWEEPRWLSRKAGSLRASPAAQHAGARKLMEEELMRKPLGEHKIETDGES